MGKRSRCIVSCPNSTGPSQTPGFRMPAWTFLIWTYRAQLRVSAWIRLRLLLGTSEMPSLLWQLTWHLEHVLAKPRPWVQLSPPPPLASSCCPLSASCPGPATLQVELEVLSGVKGRGGHLCSASGRVALQRESRWSLGQCCLCLCCP